MTMPGQFLESNLRCDECNGSGAVWNADVTELVRCNQCGGTGEIKVDRIKTYPLKRFKNWPAPDPFDPDKLQI